MNRKYTQAGWIAVGCRIECVDDNKPDIANFDPACMGQDGRSDEESCANAALCAAAPAMNHALQAMVTSFSMFAWQEKHMQEAVEMAEAALDLSGGWAS